jgi:hypothetical protein
MKQHILLLLFWCLFASQANAQFVFSDKPFKAPKKAVNLNKVGEQVTLKVGQIAFYQWTRQSNMEGFSIGIGKGIGVMESQTTHIFSDPKAQTKTNTWQWIAKQKGEAEMEIEDEKGKTRIIVVKVE